LYVEPLRKEQEFREFYVKRPSSSVSPMEELKDRIEFSNKKEKYLFLGFKGSGKSTELSRLGASLDRDDFLVVNYSIKDDLNVSDFDFRDFFVSMALNIYDAAKKEGDYLHPDIEKDFKEFIKRITRVEEEEITSQASAGLSFSRLLMLKLNREAKTREYVRKELDLMISDLIQRLNWLILDIEAKLKKKIVVIVDDLDKLSRGQQSEDFFFKNYPLLLQPGCIIIYTFPIHLAFNPFFENVRSYFNGYVVLLQLPVKDRKGNVIPENMSFYEQVIAKRINLDLLDSGVLKMAIESTGKLSEMVEVMREATLKGYRMGRGRISEKDVDESLAKMRTTFDRTLSQAHKKKLLEINSCKEARDEGSDSVLVRDLLFSLTAVEYEDKDGRWCEIDPMLLPLVEKWTQSS
jgi:hypothetical protein